MLFRECVASHVPVDAVLFGQTPGPLADVAASTLSQIQSAPVGRWNQSRHLRVHVIR
jgi:hypothetical protein